MPYNKEMKKFGLIKGLQKKYGKDKKGRIVETLKSSGAKGLPQRKIKKK